MKKSNITDITNKYRQARKGNTELVVIEGVHALKHALRFNAEVVHIAVHEHNEAEALLTTFGTDKEVAYVQKHAEVVSNEGWESLSPNPPDTGLIALAKKPQLSKALVGDTVIFIEEPHSLFNVGAIVRTAAAAGVRSFIITGRHNPWHADCISTARGLHFAFDHISLIESNDDLLKLAKQGGYTLYAMDTHTDTTIYDLTHTEGSKNIYMFGTERDGLSDGLCKAAHQVVKLPMRQGISSLNLASSVAATLFCLPAGITK